ncbi:MAG: isocitrate/isopropylmalate family dehydrogenase [Gemmatimonadota bacterium]|nr:isocitrate/isopropylmalate family dehydrogenase [Gemmatimonadota bacterium]MDH4350168.1 isocitrate/isopropylmalate family dehydrogenase [Gemmatimonadota bacterium]
MSRTLRVASIAGDGIGPEVVAAALPILDRAAALEDAGIAWEHLPLGADHYLATGETLPQATFEHLRDDVDAIFVGALGDPRVPGNEHAREILLGLRFRLDLYVNFRPVKLYHPDLTPLKPAAARQRGSAAVGAVADPSTRQSLDSPIDFVIFRENTEGSYLARGTAMGEGTADEEQISHEVHTALKAGRIIRAAFDWARAHGRTLVTMADKSNAIPAHRLWQRLFREIGDEYPTIECEHRYVDAIAMEFVRTPERFQVVVTNNLYGDILSDLGAGLVGGLGLAASANLHPGRPGLFEPVHGSAPPLAGKGVANPMAACLTGALLFEQVGLPRAAAALEHAVWSALADGVRTADLGGTASTASAAQVVLAHLA